MPRLGSAKSTTGCATCKIRRVKCDETHPICRRCTSTGRKCDGFRTNLVVKIDPLSYRSIATPTKSVNTYMNCTSEQVQAHQFFVLRLVPDMTRVISSTFWEKHILRAAVTEQPIWLAISAMSEIVRYMQNTDDTGSFNQSTRGSRLSTALQWYTRSVLEMQKIIDRQVSWSVLCGMTAIIYFCIECLLENVQNAQMIYQRTLFAVITANRQNMIKMSQDDSVADSITIMLDHIAEAHGLRSVLSQPLLSRPSSTFSSVQEARATLGSQLVCEAHGYVQSIEQERLHRSKYWLPSMETQSKGYDILAKLEWWASKVTLFRNMNPNAIDNFNWAFLHLIQRNYIIWVSAMTDGSETAFDKRHGLFEDMLQHARTVIELSGYTQPLFSFDTRVIPSLTFIATRCRHPILRREAVRLLHIGPKVENTRKASTGIVLAKKVIAIEETGHADAGYRDITAWPDGFPDANRLVWARVEQNADGDRARCWLRFGRWQLDEFENWYLTDETVNLKNP